MVVSVASLSAMGGGWISLRFGGGLGGGGRAGFFPFCIAAFVSVGGCCFPAPPSTSITVIVIIIVIVSITVTITSAIGVPSPL